MKRALTGIAAAAVVLGAVSPMAFAATTTSGLTKAGQLPIVVNGSVLSNPYEMTGKDSGNTTAFFPVYYFNQALAKIGYTATWDGTTHTWAITAPGVTAAPVAGGVGTGNTTITVNGTVVKKINTQAAKDPAASKSAAATTYLPAYYVDEILTAIGAQGSFSGQTGLKITGGATTSAAGSVTTPAITGNTLGTGAQSTPAAAVVGTGMNVSSTLTDASGNPVSGVDVTFVVTAESTGAPQPTVTANGTPVSTTDSSSPWSYQVATNAAGVATMTINTSTSNNAAYKIVAQAPYTQNGVNVQSSAAYVEWGQAGSVVLSPASASVNYSTPSNPTQGVVPVVATLFPSSTGASVSNVPVTFQDSEGWFSSSNGSSLNVPANTNYVVNTNSQGQATIYVNSNSTGITNDTVTVTQVGTNSVSDVSATITWGESGVASQIGSNTLAATGQSSGSISGTLVANTGNNLTITGVAQDALGNPVANGQLLVASDNDDSNYVSGTTSTAFPSVDAADLDNLSIPASAAYGQVITTNAQGQFSFTVNDPDTDTGVHYYLYSVDGSGNIASNLLGHGTAVATVNYQPGTGLTGIDLQAQPITASALSNTSSDTNYLQTNLTGVQSEINNATNSTTQPNGTTLYLAAANGLTNLFADPGTSDWSDTFNVSVNNGGQVVGYTDGVSDPHYLMSGANYLGFSSIPVTVQYDSTTNTFTVTVNNGTPVTGLTSTDMQNFGLIVADTTSESDTVTVSQGSIKSTAAIDFTSGTANKLASVSPVSASIGTGQFTTVTVTVDDAQGNALPNTAVPIDLTSSAQPLWITQINGVSLTQSEPVTSGDATEQTPIPLYAPNGWSNASNYGTVTVPGVVTASNVGTSTPTIYAYTDANGKVSFTVQDGNVPYYQATAPFVTSSTAAGTAGDSLFVGYNSSNFAIELGAGTSAAAAGVDNSLSTLNYSTGTDALTASVPASTGTNNDATQLVLSFNKALYDASGNPIADGTDLTADFTYTGTGSITSADYSASAHTVTLVISGAANGDTVVAKANELQDYDGTFYTPVTYTYASAGTLWS